MAITDETLRLIGGLRVQLDTTVDRTTDDLVRAWARAWQDIAAEWQALAADLETALAAGQPINPRRFARTERAARALRVSRVALDELSRAAGVRILQAAGPAVYQVPADQAVVLGSQLPAEARVETRFARDPEALDAIVARTTEQITALTVPLSAEATEAMRTAIVRAVALGEHPRAAATRMVRAAQDGFAGGLTRAMTIARTEILDAHRAASLATDRANRDVLAGWVWTASLTARTCPACWAQHGSVHPVDEPGPLDHQNGRCTRSPLLKPWRELGITAPEPASVLPDARAVFAGLPEADQVAVMGPARLELLRTGRASWDDLATRRSTPGWRDSIHATPVSALPRRAA